MNYLCKVHIVRQINRSLMAIQKVLGQRLGKAQVYLNISVGMNI